MLLDARGAVAGQSQIRGKSSGGTIFAGTTEQAIEKAAERIVQFLGGRTD